MNRLSEIEGRAEGIASLFKALAHPGRVMIVAVLRGGEASVCELEEMTDIHQPTLSQQLGVLRHAGLVETRRASKQIYYRLDDRRATALIDFLNSPEMEMK